MSRPPRPTTELVVDVGDPIELARRLHFCRAEVVVVADASLADRVGDDVVDAFVDSLADTPAAGMVVGVVVDETTGRPWPVPPGLAITGHPLPPAPVPAERTPTMVPGALWAARREALEGVGGLGGHLGRFSTIDLAWRLWLRGPTVLRDPGVRVPGPATAGWRPAEGEAAVEAEAHALSMVYRNLRGDRLDLALGLARALSPVRLRCLHPTVDDASAGVHAFDAARPAADADRHVRQFQRRRPDVEILEVLAAPLEPDLDDPAFRAEHAAAVASVPELDRLTHRWRVVVATADSISAHVAGPAIRALRIARELAREHEVRLVTLTRAELDDPDLSIEAITTDDVDDLLDWADVFVFQGWVLAGNQKALTTDTVIVADIYDPLHLEQLEQARDDGEYVRRHAVRHATAVLNEQLLRGDFFLCASAKQRDLWLGNLASLGRINPATYDRDPSLSTLLAVVPFGISDEPPVRTGPALKGVVPGIGPDDKVVLWGGGVYNWFDPLALIRAVDRLRQRVPEVRLVFLGMRHPNPDVPEMRVARECRELADELGVTGTHVFFNEGWVPFDERQNYLLDADVAVTTHFDHVETEFSFRTRVLDYLWAGIPTVATEGDALATLIATEQLGLTVPPDDVAALEGALGRLLTDEALAAGCRERIAAISPEMRWNRVLTPLVEFCRAPTRAPDVMEGLADPTHGAPLLGRDGPRGLSLWTRVKRDVTITRNHIRAGGVQLVLNRLVSRFRRLIADRRST